MHSDAPTVTAYLQSLEDDRREAISAVRQTILDHLPEGYDETMRWGMISYEVPLKTCPDTYNGKPLMLAALASQKRHMSVYLTGLYAVEALKSRVVGEWTSRGTRLDMGKSCIRFRNLGHLELDLVGEVIGAFEVPSFVEIVQGATRKK